MLTLRSHFVVSLVAATSLFHPPLKAFSMSSGSGSSSAGNVQNCEKYLTYDYRTVGSILKLKDDTEFYGVGNPRSKHGVILIPDTWGWNAGRIRNIADFLGANDCYAAVPKLMGSTKNTGSEGPSMFETHNIGEYMKGLAFDANLKPKLNSLMQFMFSEGIEKIAIVGFSWGGWVTINVLASDLGENFVCGILPHPSLNLEERMYGGSLTEVFSNIRRPILLMPARGDPDEYTSLARLLKYKCPTTEVVDYHTLEHGFLLRGNIDDRETKHACVKSLNEILVYMQHHFDMKSSDLIRELGKEAYVLKDTFKPSGSKRSWWEYGREKVNEMSSGVKDSYDRTKEQAGQMGQRMQEGYDQTKERVKEGYDQTKDQTNQMGQRMQEGYDQTKQKTKEGYVQTKEYVKEGYDQTKQKTKEAGQQMQEGYDQTKNKAQESYDKTKQQTKEAGQQMQEGYEQTKEGVKEGYEHGKERATKDERSGSPGRGNK